MNVMTNPIAPGAIATIVLRFRDLALPPGDTIRLHRQIIDDKGTTWWGWWNKSGEVVPDKCFRALKKLIDQNGSLDILLFDSGQREIRNAKLSNIVWQVDHSRQPPDDKELTPTYYNDHKFLAWFVLTQISDPAHDADNQLKKWTYERVDDFFETVPSPYGIFYGKCVYGVGELKQQDRTIWFLRPFMSGDRTNEVSLVGKSSTEPTHFTRSYASEPSRHLLWLSDIHFGDHHEFPLVPSATKKDLGQSINDALTASNVHDLAGVIVSGDITWKALEEEFEQARRFLERIARSPTVLDYYRFAVCPGNHDLAFSDAPDKKDAAVHDSVAPEAARKNYSSFYQHFFNVAPNAYLSMGRRILLGEQFPVEIVCLNSSLLEQKPGWFQGHGFVGETQLLAAASEFRWGKEYVQGTPRAFRIVVMHHHLVPVVYSEEPLGGTSYSVVLDAERVMRWLLRHRVNLVLHGHMHQRFYTKIVRPLDDGSDEEHCVNIIGLGSSGVEPSHRKNISNMFGVLTAYDDHVLVKVHTVYPGSEESKEIGSIKVPKAI
jgi:3',5'-cyclic AMP phosphodiesterase CpdA